MATPKDEFYIGWSDKAPPSYGQAVRLAVIGAFVLLITAAVIMVVSQRGFVGSVFEFGQITTIEGTLVREPVPMLRTTENGQIRSYLLVGFGKMGALPTLEAIEVKTGQTLSNQVVRMRGSKIYYGDRSAFELTEGSDAFVEIVADATPIQVQPEPPQQIQLIGEIYDPKCAFGVMKPGYGKPHRSCAIRCISGGIPPVLRGLDAAGTPIYCILKGTDGRAINSDVLPFVADQIRICGRLEREADWLVLYTDPANDIHRLKPHWIEGDIPMCN